MSKNYAISRVSWYTVEKRMTLDEARPEFWFLVKFLQDNGLVRRELARSIEDITEEFALYSGDLTDDGLKLLRTAYSKWLRKIDKGMSPSDTTLLERELSKMSGRA
jgi:hypothetical protein